MIVGTHLMVLHPLPTLPRWTWWTWLLFFCWLVNLVEATIGEWSARGLTSPDYLGFGQGGKQVPMILVVGCGCSFPALTK